jgi:hypothetical protein
MRANVRDDLTDVLIDRERRLHNKVDYGQG